MKKYLAIPVVLLACGFAHAQGNSQTPSPYSKEYAACIAKAGPPGIYDQSAASNCDVAEIKFQKKRINTAYNKILKLWQDNPDAIARLNNAQKAWVQWRDETYGLLSEDGGMNGQVVYIVSSSFMLKSLADQANLLEGILSANGGD